jgi:hypothetical protein
MMVCVGMTYRMGSTARLARTACSAWLGLGLGLGLAGCAADNPSFDEPSESADGATVGGTASGGLTRGDTEPRPTTGDTARTGGLDTHGDDPTTVTTGPPVATSDTGQTPAPCTTPSVCESPSPLRLGACDPYAQDCAPGFKCTPRGTDDTWDTTGCVPIDPAPVPVGGVCTTQGTPTSGQDDCTLGALCWNLDVDLQGTCVELCGCGPTAPTCQGGGNCFEANSGILAICADDCDPLTNDCPDGQVCVASVVAGTVAFGCVPDAAPKAVDVGSPCEFANVCGPGKLCIPAEQLDNCTSAACCAPVCAMADPGSCDLQQSECAPLTTSDLAPECLPQVGICP